MRNKYLPSTHKSIFLMLLCFITFQTFAQVNYTANDRVIAYDSSFRYGMNMGFYPNWTSEQLGNISAGNPQLGLKGIGVNTARPALYEENLETFGYDALVPTFESYYNLGIRDMTVILGGPSGAHRDYYPYCPNKTSQLFANMYEPIWDGGANGTPINENNYYALYVWKTVNQYKKYVRIWEVLNEPDYDDGTTQQWKGDFDLTYGWWQQNPQPCDYNLASPIFHYNRLLRISWEVIKAADPTAYVEIGALGYAHFLDAVLRNTDNPVDGSVTPQYPLKAGAYFDLMGYHTYPHLDGSLWTYNIQSDRILGFHRNSDGAIDSGVIKKQRFFQNVLDKYGYNGSVYPKKPWIITEFNLPRKAFEARYVGSDALQRNSVIKAAVTCYQHDILQMHAYQLGDRATPETAVFEFELMGFYKKLELTQPYNVSVNDEGIAYKTTSDLLFGSKFDVQRTAQLNLPATISGGAFRHPNGNYVYVLWAKTLQDYSENASATYSFPASLNVNQLNKYEWNYSYANNASIVNAQNIALTGAPIFLSSSTIVQPDLPDLTLENLNVLPPSVQQGQVIDFKFDLKNIGVGAASGNFNVKSYLSTDQTLSADDYQNGIISTANYNPGFTSPQVLGALTVSATLPAGQYYLILKVDADNQIAESNENNNILVSAKTIIITAAQTSGNYCASKGSAPWELWVKNVQFNTMNYASDKFKDYNSLGYSDYTNINTTVNRGLSYPLSITPGLSWIGNLSNAYCRVWIDFNKNNVFEASELVLEKNNQNPFTANVLIPTTAATGNTRMRVSLKNGAYPTACETFAIGEVEDYTINIQGGADLCANDTQAPIFNFCPRDTTVTIAQNQTVVNYTWTSPTATDNCSTPSVIANYSAPNLQLSDGQEGRLVLTAKDAAGNTTTCGWSVTAIKTTTGSADIGLTIAAASTTYRQWTPTTFRISAANNSTTAFSNIKIEFKFPAKTVGGGTATPSVGTWQQWCIGGIECTQWLIPSLGANETATLDVPIYVLDATGIMTATTTLLSATPTDGNAANNAATVTLEPQSIAVQGQVVAQRPTQEIPIVFQKIAPNPSVDALIIDLESIDKRGVVFDFKNTVGETVFSEKRQVEKGTNRLEFDVSLLPQGVYFIVPITKQGYKVVMKFVKM